MDWYAKPKPLWQVVREQIADMVKCNSSGNNKPPDQFDIHSQRMERAQRWREREHLLKIEIMLIFSMPHAPPLYCHTIHRTGSGIRHL